MRLKRFFQYQGQQLHFTTSLVTCTCTRLTALFELIPDLDDRFSMYAQKMKLYCEDQPRTPIGPFIHSFMQGTL